MLSINTVAVYDTSVDLGKPNPLLELKELDEAVDRVNNLGGLRPIFYRLDEIALNYAEDIKVQVAIGDIKQHILNRGNQLHQPNESRAISPLDETTTIGPFPVAAQSTASSATLLPPELPADPAYPPPAPPQPPANRKDARRWGVALTLIAVPLAIVIAVILVRARNAAPPKPILVPMQIATVPTGASVRIDGVAKCTSDCSVSLPPGAYQVSASLDGYKLETGSAMLVAGQTAALNLTLQPQPQTVRIHTNLSQGSVSFDDQLPIALQHGEYTFENVQAGHHTVKMTGSGGDASFSFDLGAAKLPMVTGTVVVHESLAVLVASFGNHARVVTSSGPLKLAVNQHVESDAGPSGVYVENLVSGENEFTVGELGEQQILKERFGPAPMLTALIAADPNLGTLIISTKESGVRVFLNDREYPGSTRRGTLRIQTIGPAVVRVLKNGFREPPPQVAQVTKGSQVRLEFKMVPQPEIPPIP